MANVTIKNALKTSMQNFAAEAYRRFPTKADLTDVSGKVTTLIGSDSNKSARAIAAEELAKQLIPENAKESLDTLGEISAWIQSHPDEVGAINRKLTLGTHEVEGEQKQYESVKDFVEDYVSSQLGDSALSGSDAVSIVNKVVSLIVDSTNANGLAIDSNGLKLGLASASANGALSSTDWATFNGKQDTIAVSAATGSGNVVTAVELDEDGKTIKQTKGLTALVEADFEAVTASEIATIFNAAKAEVDAENEDESGTE